MAFDINQLVRFRCLNPGATFRIQIGGPSGSGKTNMLTNVFLPNLHRFIPGGFRNFACIRVFSGVANNPKHRTWRNFHPKVHYYPANALAKTNLDRMFARIDGENRELGKSMPDPELWIADDCLLDTDVDKSNGLGNVFAMYSNNRRISIIATTQSLIGHSSSQVAQLLRHIRMNATAVVIMGESAAQSQQLRQLNGQLFPTLPKNLLSSLMEAGKTPLWLQLDSHYNPQIAQPVEFTIPDQRSILRIIGNFFQLDKPVLFFGPQVVATPTR